MIVPIAALILGTATWLGNKAAPAIWRHHIQQPSKIQVDLAKDLCEKHNDCDAEKYWALPNTQLQEPK
jgi:hypothetical protein